MDIQRRFDRKKGTITFLEPLLLLSLLLSHNLLQMETTRYSIRKMNEPAREVYVIFISLVFSGVELGTEMKTRTSRIKRKRQKYGTTRIIKY
ncbi:hypothetical protein DBV15_08014 [Temnothorax longispinosus]|uniref:Uncharacterized protein n=1 Tax=Temnothorax longispinosus TaxID=300112 RepID=A0A4S2L1G4_9HYME|nr:hypothetical protein DBV15_08014 [Temnothorax longispinosus]